MMMPLRRHQAWLPGIINDFFDNDWVAKPNATAPAVNVIENEAGFRVEVAAPGITKDDCAVRLGEDNYLVVSVEKRENECKEDKVERYLRREFYCTKFQQSLLVPDNVDKEKIAANVENGVLIISLPKITEKEKRKNVKQIEVK